jgi:cytochrome c
MRPGLLTLAVSLLTCATALADGDPDAGKKVFNKCAICHSVEAGVNKIGPSLFGVVGRPSASIANFTYSPAMAAANKVWDAKELDIYLTEPKAEVPGTKMLFMGVKDPTDRQNLIAYLATLK